MLNLRTLAICVGAAALMAGCGGTDTNNPLPSIYAGSWTGNWTGVEANDGGTLTWTVTSDGSMSGTMGRSGGISGDTSGIVANTGQYTATAGFSTGGNFLIRGAAVLYNNALNGTFSYSWLGRVYNGTFAMTNASATAGAAKVRK